MVHPSAIECPIEGAPPAPCCKHSMVEYDRSVYIYGGEGEFEGEFSRGDQRSTRQIHNKMYKYDTRSARWHALPTVGALPERRIPFARRSHSAVVVKNFHSGPSILIWAGAGLEPIKARDRLFNDMWAFNIEEETWTFVYQKGNIPTPRSGHSATLIGDLMYVFGGLVNAGSGNGTQLFTTYYPPLRNSYFTIRRRVETRVRCAVQEPGPEPGDFVFEL